MQTKFWMMMCLWSASYVTGETGATNSINAGHVEEHGTNTLSYFSPIVITATRIPEEADVVSRTVLAVSRDAIKQKHITKPVEALQDEPGIWLQKTGQGGGTPIVRGMMGNSVLYLVDGIRINNGRLFSGPNAFFNQIDVGAMDSIEVLKGPGSVQYGSDAMGGVIHVLTPPTDYFPSTTEYMGKIAAQYSSADNGLLAQTRARIAGPDVNAVAGVTYFSSGDVRTGGGEVLEDMSMTSYGAFAKLSAILYPGNVLTLGYMENIRLDVERYDQSRRNPNSRDPRFFTPWEDRRIVYIKDAIDIRDGLVSHIDTYGYWQNYCSSSENNSQQNTTTFRKQTTDLIQNIYGIGISAETPLLDETLKFVYGGDYRFEYFQESLDLLTWRHDGYRAISYPLGKTPNGSYDVADAFAMLVWTPLDDLRLSSGVRFESSHLDANPGAQDPTAGFTQSDLDLDSRWNAVTYDLGSVYKIIDELAWTANASTGYRAPTYSDVLSYGPFTYGVNVPSPSVEPEKCAAFESGFRWESRDVSAKAVGFGTYLMDMINSRIANGYTDLNGNGFEDAGEHNYTKQNTGSGYIYGLETSGEWRFIPQWALFANGAWTEGWNKNEQEPLRFIPPLYGLVGLRWEVTSWMTMSAFTRMVAAQTRVSTSDKSDPARASDPAYSFPSATNPPLRPDYSVPGYLTYHARADFKVSKYGKVFVGVDNITDVNYRVAYSRQDAPGVCATVGAEWTF